MMIIDRFIALWIAGILLGAGSITFGSWQLGLVTPMLGFNFELLALWLDFLALVALYNRSRAWTINLFGLSLVPLVASASCVALFDDDMQRTSSAQLMGGGILLLSLCSIALYASAMDYLPRVNGRRPEPSVV